MARVFAYVAIGLSIAVASAARPGFPPGVRIALSAVPAVLWTSAAFRGRPQYTTRAVLIFLAVAVLLLHPARYDAAPFFLVMLIADGTSDSIVTAAVVAVASSALLSGLEIAGRYQGSIIWVMAFAFTWSGAALVQSRLRLLDAVSERAVIEERQRIARELHDVIAHSLAVTMLQLTGARLALERDPEDAARALAEAERLGRESLAEIRRTVGLLAPAEPGPISALPTATDVPGLVGEMHDAGLEVTLHCSGDLAAVAPAPGLALYRIVQESLANVVKHAPGTSASVDIEVRDGAVRLEVANLMNGSAAAVESREHAGMGLRSMHDRAETLGGTLDAGAHDGTWCVAASIPRELDS
jgi:signal transduction histidine kinase